MICFGLKVTQVTSTHISGVRSSDMMMANIKKAGSIISYGQEVKKNQIVVNMNTSTTCVVVKLENKCLSPHVYIMCKNIHLKEYYATVKKDLKNLNTNCRKPHILVS